MMWVGEFSSSSIPLIQVAAILSVAISHTYCMYIAEAGIVCSIREPGAVRFLTHQVQSHRSKLKNPYLPKYSQV
jgi:hypothetical protein